MHPVQAFIYNKRWKKHLKGYLLYNGWKLRRIHNLETLLNSALIYDPHLEQFRSACQKITQYYVEERYPFLEGADLSCEEIRASLQEYQVL